VPFRTTAPACALTLNSIDNRAGERGRAKRDEHLIDDDLVQDLMASVAKGFRKTPGVPARSLDEIGQTASAERSEGRPQLDAPGAA
jgi:hypothetical protein